MDYYQRLVIDRKNAINYDAMGYAEYEQGATTWARFALVRLFRAGKLERRTVKFLDIRTGDSCSVVAFASEALLWPLRHGLLRADNKGPLKIEPVLKNPPSPSRIIGWMGCGHTSPILLLRDQAHIPQADAFFNDVIAYWAENPGEEPLA